MAYIFHRLVSSCPIIPTKSHNVFDNTTCFLSSFYVYIIIFMRFQLHWVGQSSASWLICSSQESFLSQTCKFFSFSLGYWIPPGLQTGGYWSLLECQWRKLVWPNWMRVDSDTVMAAWWEGDHSLGRSESPLDVLEYSTARIKLGSSIPITQPSQPPCSGIFHTFLTQFFLFSPKSFALCCTKDIRELIDGWYWDIRVLKGYQITKNCTYLICVKKSD